MACTAEFRWTSAARTDVGLVRNRNEDAYLAQPSRGLWAVADGMGGHAYGDVAGRMVGDALAGVPTGDSISQFAASARERLLGVNQQLRAEAMARGVPVMGSTVVVLLACGHELACLWAGDSRIYLYRHARLRQLTRDHNQAAPGGLAANMITRAVGAADALDLDQELLDVRDGDMFLLCSDGLSNPVDEQAIAAALASGDCAQATQSLIAQALANGGRDNVTAVVVRADDMAGDKTMLNPAL
ncbi:MAG: protein phosphatase 2C domain-containing protein [Massilia sp.]